MVRFLPLLKKAPSFVLAAVRVLNLAFGEGGILRPSSLTLGYLADNASNPGENFGLANGDYAALAQLNFNLSDRFAVAATYVHGYHNQGMDQDLNNSNQSTGPIVGTALANDPSSLYWRWGSACN